jgi:hypothetical protein
MREIFAHRREATMSKNFLGLYKNYSNLAIAC